MTSKLPTGSIEGRLRSYKSLKYDLMDSRPVAYLASRFCCSTGSSASECDCCEDTGREELAEGGEVGSSKPFSNMSGPVDGSARLILGGVSIGKKLLLLPLDGALLRPKPNMDEALGRP